MKGPKWVLMTVEKKDALMAEKMVALRALNVAVLKEAMMAGSLVV